MNYTRSKLVEELKRDEGYRDRPYLDSLGVVTIGIGHALGNIGIGNQTDRDLITALGVMDKPWPEAVLLHLFEIDCDEHEAALVNLARDKGVDLERLSDEQTRALINMTFNMGAGRLGFFHKMWAALAAGDYYEAARQALDSKWAKQVGVRSTRIAAQLRKE